MTRDEAIARLREARVGRLATVRPDGTPHVVPFVFALVEDGDDLRVYWAVDDKPKRRRVIQRLVNIRGNPAVEFIVDGYDEDWTRLWWVRVRGRARVVDTDDERRSAAKALAARYAQYARTEQTGPAVAIDVETVSGWTGR
jgi:PPOX class probable F420-dependent enzyme